MEASLFTFTTVLQILLLFSIAAALVAAFIKLTENVPVKEEVNVDSEKEFIDEEKQKLENVKSFLNDDKVSVETESEVPTTRSGRKYIKPEITKGSTVRVFDPTGKIRGKAEILSRGQRRARFKFFDGTEGRRSVTNLKKVA